MARVVFALAVFEAILAIASWAVSVLYPDLGVRSLLDGEGIRWFFGHFTEIMASPLLVWLVVVASAVGCAADCGVVKALFSLRSSLFRERIAIVFALVAALVYVGLIVALVASPHAVLVSASGRLFPSPFSVSLVPVVAFGIVLCSVIYGVASGRYLTLAQVFHSLFVGIEWAAPLFILYIVLIQLYYSSLFCLAKP